MSRSIQTLGIITLLCSAWPSAARAQGGPDYTPGAQTLDAGGGRGSVHGYTFDASLGGIAGAVGTFTGGTLRPGYCGQLYDIAEIRITPEINALNEGSALVLAANVLYDDGTQAFPANSAFAWSIAGGWPASVAGGWLNLTAAYAQTSTVVRAAYGDAAGTRTITVLNTWTDNYGTYWSDGVPDDWQIQYFGFDAPNARGSQDYDGDGVSNLTEFQRGLNPTLADSDQDGLSDATDPTPTGDSRVARGSDDYLIAADTLDAGGGAAFSAFAYAQVTSIDSVQGAVLNIGTASTNTYGYIGQLDEPLLPVADVGVTLASLPVIAGQGVHYSETVTVANGGPDPAGNVSAAVTWPTEVTFISASTPVGDWTRDGNTLTWSVGTLANGASAALTVVLRSDTSGDRVSGVTAQGEAADPDSGNNTASATTRVVPLATISGNTTVGAGDLTTIENKFVVVNPGVTLTVGGQHRVAGMQVDGTVTHARGDTNGVNLTVDGLLTVSASGRIDVTGQGYRGGYRDGNPSADAETNAFGAFSANGRAGGSYGSMGLAVTGTVNPLYGSDTVPVWLGSGGSVDSGGSSFPGGNGGGRIDIEAGTMAIDGQVLADGGAGANRNWSGDGSGGSIRLRLTGGAFSGSGTIRSAGGANADGGSPLGGLGRIAVTGYGTNLFAGALGYAGTLFRQPAGTGGDLMLDTTTLVIPLGATGTYASLSSGAGASVITNRGTLALTTDALTLPARVTLVQDGTICGTGRTDGVIGALTVVSNAVMTHTRGNARGVQVRVAGLFRVEAGGKIDVTDKGFRGGYRDGNPTADAEPNAFNTFSAGGRAGGSYGSLGLSQGGTVNPLFGSETAPVWLGSGGSVDVGGSSFPAGNGGGLIDIEAGAMAIDGQLLADGGAGANSYWSGDGSGGSIWLRLTGGAFSGNGIIRTAGGANASGGSPLGGLGRIAVTGYGTNLFAGALGYAGTLFRQQAGTGGDLLLDATTLVIPPGVTNTYGSLSSGAGASVITNRGTLALTTDALTLPARVTLVQDGTVCGTGHTDGVIGALTVASNAVMTHTRGFTNGLQVRVSGLFRVEAGGLIDVTAKGYRGGYRDGNPSGNAETNAFGTFSANGAAGGSYGSLGLSQGGTVNALYGFTNAPVWLGSGGSSGLGGFLAGNGGGRIDVEAGSMTIDGQLLADGGVGSHSYWAGDGSGGSIWLRLTGGALSGVGAIRALGGANGAAGGGGRIAVTGYATTNITGLVSAGNGTLYWEAGIPLDTDGDGLTDTDEGLRGTNPNLSDTDGDGASDGEEVAAGTNPLNRASVLAFIAAIPAPDGLTVTWQGGTQVTQLLQRLTCLSPLTVQSVYTNLPPTALTNSYLDIGGTNTTLFYRLQILR